MMMMIKRLQLRSLFADKGFLAAVIAMVLLVITIIILSIIYVHPGELRVPVRYSRFDAKNYTFDQWYYLLNYAVFGAVVCAAHTLLGAKLYQLKGRSFAIGFIVLGITILIIASIFFLAIVKVVSLLQ